jgi:hypothetical protein
MTVDFLNPDFDLWAVAAHEGGHQFLSAHHFGLDSQAVATATRGVCFGCRAPDPLKDAAIAWGGLVVQSILTNASTLLHPISDTPLSEATLKQWCDEAMRMPQHIAEGHDLAGMPSYYALQGCELAYRVLTANRQSLKACAQLLYLEACHRCGADDRQTVADFKREQVEEKRQAIQAKWEAEPEDVLTRPPGPRKAEYAMPFTEPGGDAFLRAVAGALHFDACKATTAIERWVVHMATDGHRVEFTEANYKIFSEWVASSADSSHTWGGVAQGFLDWWFHHGQAGATVPA